MTNSAIIGPLCVTCGNPPGTGGSCARCQGYAAGAAAEREKAEALSRQCDDLVADMFKYEADRQAYQELLTKIRKVIVDALKDLGHPPKPKHPRSLLLWRRGGRRNMLVQIVKSGRSFLPYTWNTLRQRPVQWSCPKGHVGSGCNSTDKNSGTTVAIWCPICMVEYPAKERP